MGTVTGSVETSTTLSKAELIEVESDRVVSKRSDGDLKSYVVEELVNSEQIGYRIKHTTHVVGYTPAHKETAKEALEYFIATIRKRQAQLRDLSLRLSEELAELSDDSTD